MNKSATNGATSMIAQGVAAIAMAASEKQGKSMKLYTDPWRHGLWPVSVIDWRRVSCGRSANEWIIHDGLTDLFLASCSMARHIDADKNVVAPHVGCLGQHVLHVGTTNV
jgi:hypothetical protein